MSPYRRIALGMTVQQIVNGDRTRRSLLNDKSSKMSYKKIHSNPSRDRGKR